MRNRLIRATWDEAVHNCHGRMVSLDDVTAATRMDLNQAELGRGRDRRRARTAETAVDTVPRVLPIG